MVYNLTKTHGKEMPNAKIYCDLRKYDVRDQEMLLRLAIPQTSQVYTLQTGPVFKCKKILLLTFEYRTKRASVNANVRISVD